MLQLKRRKRGVWFSLLNDFKFDFILSIATSGTREDSN